MIPSDSFSKQEGIASYAGKNVNDPAAAVN